jgi:hypothetical protein
MNAQDPLTGRCVARGPLGPAQVPDEVPGGRRTSALARPDGERNDASPAAPDRPRFLRVLLRALGVWHS